MGKIRRVREKYHSVAKKNLKSSSEDNKMVAEENDNIVGLSSEEVASNMVIQDNIFSTINIDKSKLSQRLPDFDARSAITSKTLKGLSLKKKDKLKLRREYFMQKINAIEVKKKKDKERKKREKTAVVGDMAVIEEALPTLDLLMKTSTTKEKVPHVPKKRCVQKAKNRVKKGLSNIKSFKQVLKHSAFKNNPGATINEHLHNKLKQEESDES
ncbi:hypothetical protein LOTGIDRAFT_234815 [Lottia gigantea]|uniref:Uncharacterized protein n=1 Tax=Lottia gigantea TaxID=225164 RepID=V3ZUL1_LOTGI|nr:hypothetical protein LOTGIDRAFT_234815 [Lottia gigantea]ESO88047.1 hypothetical protein LOTGIDRAFT_234815 [Lottia gigantea]